MSEAAPGRPAPRPLGLTAEFYAHCAAGELRFQRCRSCHAWRHLPRFVCARCGSRDWSWERSSGRGRVFTWTVTHRAPHPAFREATPYAVIVVEMEEGVRLVSRLRDLAPDRIELDLPVEVGFEPLSEEMALPIFRPRFRPRPA